MLSFEDFLTERNDAIDDLFFRLLKTVNTEDDQEKRICAAKEALKNLKASEEGFPIDNVLAKEAIRLAEDVLKEHKVLSGKPLEWDMSIIGDITETAEKILNDAGIQTCFPFFADDEVPCVNTNVMQKQLANARSARETPRIVLVGNAPCSKIQTRESSIRMTSNTGECAALRSTGNSDFSSTNAMASRFLSASSNMLRHLLIQTISGWLSVSS